MLLAFLLILFSVGGSYGDFECFTENVGECEEIVQRFEYPETTEDLLQLCKDFKAFGSCVARVKENCNEDARYVHYVQQAVSYLNSSCQADNPTFKVISSNLQCVTSVVKILDFPCWGSFSANNRKKIHDQLDIFRDSPSDVKVCLMQLMEITCRGSKFGHHCGEEVKNAVEETLVKIGAVQERCTPEILERLEPFSYVYLAILNEEIGLQNVLYKTRK